MTGIGVTVALELAWGLCLEEGGTNRLGREEKK